MPSDAMLDNRVYLDANATTRPSAAVREAIGQALADGWGNPSSLHARGRSAARVLSNARRDVAEWLGAAGSEVVFTSGGTEADRLGVLGALRASGERRHIVASSIEHDAIRSLLQSAKNSTWGVGVEVTWVRPNADGVVAADAVAEALRPDTALVTVMWANNETGCVQPVQDVAAACRENRSALLVDAVQAAGKIPVDFGALGADLLVTSAHKVHGPMGIGALLVRAGGRWKSPYPATHEMARRAGTEGVPLVAGFAAAARECAGDLTEAAERMAALRDRFERVVTGALADVRVNGGGHRTPNTTNLEFVGLESDRLLALLDRAGVDASNGSACSTRSPEPSHVLRAMGRSRREALAAVRFSLSRHTTGAEIDRAVGAVIESVETLRKRSRN